MIPEIGHILLVIALVLSFVGGLGSFALKKELPILKISFILSLLLVGSLFALIYSFLIDDFSVAYVAQNSNINLPIYYKFAATWGAHEGSLILWILSMNIWLVAFMFFDNSRNTKFSNYIFGNTGIVS